jgi:DNA-binding transcriptional LysR family regulator
MIRLLPLGVAMKFGNILPYARLATLTVFPNRPLQPKLGSRVVAVRGIPSAMPADLSLTTLRLFAAVCEEGTLTRAASREAIAPSAVSKRLAEMEAALGVMLFDRDAKGMTLTAAGESLLHHTRRMLMNAEQAVLEMADHARGVRGFVRMLGNLSAIVQFLPEDLQSFMASHPSIKIDLEERPSSGVIAGVRDGIAELGICSEDVELHGLQALPYRTDHLIVVMRGDNRLAQRGRRVAFADTLDHDYIGLHQASSINTRTLVEARKAGQPLKLRIHVPGFDAVCRMAQAGMGIGILPERAFELLGRPMGLTAKRLTDPWGLRKLLIVVRPQPLSTVGALLVSHLRAEAGEGG